MSTSAPVFGRVALGQIASKLHRVCRACPHAEGPCVQGERCPVSLARESIGRNLFSGAQIDPTLDPAALPGKPPGAVFDQLLLEEALTSVGPICNTCMFHTERCFLNMLHALLEVALERPERKPFSRKPGLHPVDHRG